MIVLLQFLKSMPAIVAFVVEMKKLWDEQFEASQRKTEIQKLTELLKSARERKNTDELEKYVRSLSRNS